MPRRFTAAFPANQRPQPGGPDLKSKIKGGSINEVVVYVTHLVYNVYRYNKHKGAKEALWPQKGV